MAQFWLNHKENILSSNRNEKSTTATLTHWAARTCMKDFASSCKFCCSGCPLRQTSHLKGKQKVDTQNLRYTLAYFMEHYHCNLGMFNYKNQKNCITRSYRKKKEFMRGDRFVGDFFLFLFLGGGGGSRGYVGWQIDGETERQVKQKTALTPVKDKKGFNKQAIKRRLQLEEERELSNSSI